MKFHIVQCLSRISMTWNELIAILIIIFIPSFSLGLNKWGGLRSMDVYLLTESRNSCSYFNLCVLPYNVSETAGKTISSSLYFDFFVDTQQKQLYSSISRSKIERVCAWSRLQLIYNVLRLGEIRPFCDVFLSNMQTRSRKQFPSMGLRRTSRHQTQDPFIAQQYCTWMCN